MTHIEQVKSYLLIHGGPDATYLSTFEVELIQRRCRSWPAYAVAMMIIELRRGRGRIQNAPREQIPHSNEPSEPTESTEQAAHLIDDERRDFPMERADELLSSLRGRIGTLSESDLRLFWYVFFQYPGMSEIEMINHVVNLRDVALENEQLQNQNSPLSSLQRQIEDALSIPLDERIRARRERKNLEEETKRNQAVASELSRPDRPKG